MTLQNTAIHLVRSSERWDLPSGKHTKNYGTSQLLMGKSTISMAIFNSYGCLPESRLEICKD
jgi:hypothetical protein